MNAEASNLMGKDLNTETLAILDGQSLEADSLNLNANRLSRFPLENSGSASLLKTSTNNENPPLLTTRFPELIGKEENRYFILSKLSDDNVSANYKAMDTSANKIVLLQFLHSSTCWNDRDKVNFKKCIQNVSDLSKVNVGAVYEVEEDCVGRLFIVTPYYYGVTLKSMLLKGGISLKESLDIFFQVALGLGAAHKNGIVHGQLTPANILILKDGCVKILNFEFAHHRGAASTQYFEEANVLPYMSPERTNGGKATVVSDIWSLGTILFEMLSGQRLNLKQSAFLNVSRLSIAYHLKKILIRSLQHHEVRRYQSVDKMRRDLKGYKRKRVKMLSSKIPRIFQFVLLSSVGLALGTLLFADE